MKNESSPKRCPKCGKENPDDARFCNACGCSIPHAKLDVRISRAAIVSFVCSLFTLGCFVPGLIATMDPQLLDPQSDMVQNIACVSILAGAIAVLLGVIALALIGSSGGRSTGYGFAAIGAAIPPILIGVLFWHNIGRWGPTISKGMVCGTNLSRLGKAMLLYSNDYDDTLPSAVGPNGLWVARLPWWAADNRKDAYGLSDPNATYGRASVSASLYLLVKYDEATPKSFVCNADYGATEFKPAKYGLGDEKLLDLWDFGPNPPLHCSYSYHLPYSKHRLTINSDPRAAVAADRNPWMDSPFEKAREFHSFDPDGNREASKAGNAIAHKQDGQNVLFMDCHVGFELRSFGGINDDNIYTYWNGEDIRRGTPPRLGSKPADRADSLLVNDPAIPK
jgi:hypothetical protein